MPDTTQSTKAWRHWFDTQYELRQEVDDSIKKAMRGDRSSQFGAALMAALIEYLSERMRSYLTLPESDVPSEEGSDG